jgi:protein-tyrosine phosphatase
MIDLHTHLLPGLDDGARDLAMAVEMARSFAADGVTVVCGTPHVRDDYPTTPEEMEAALALVRDAVAEAGIAIEVRGGGEIALEQLPLLDDDARRRLGLGGNPALLLLETPYSIWLADTPRTCAQLRQQGIVPVLAHPERNPYVHENPLLVEEVVRAGGIVQLTAASVDGRLGRANASCARKLLELELAHCIASDAHGPGVREVGMSSAVTAVGGGEEAFWLTQHVPAALLAGSELPPRPPRQPRGFFSRLRG